MVNTLTLQELHQNLCHSVVRRLAHYVRPKNLPFSMEDVKRTCSSCRVCAELKPRFYIPQKGTLIKATQPFERIAIDFKGPPPTCTRNMYLLVIVDEFSLFPFCYPCPNMNFETVKCLNDLFTLCGVPSCVHSDNARSFLSREIKHFFTERGIATSHCSIYHPTGNSQVEKYMYNGVIWCSVRLSLKSQNLPIERRESVLPNVLHSLRSLLCTATNATLHEFFFHFHRKSGLSLPTWLTHPGPVLMRNFLRKNKHDALVREVNLTEENTCFARIRLDNGREATKDLAPCPPRSHSSKNLENQLNPTNDKDVAELHDRTGTDESSICESENLDTASDNASENLLETTTAVRRSARANKGISPQRYGDPVDY